ncbi:MAG: hypothetical protein J6Y55_06475 [Bacteroidales bacterium]|nr:hypothetical protein [Bacteroidales bacterium]
MKRIDNLSTNANHIYVDTNVIVGAYYYELTKKKSYLRHNKCLEFLYKLRGKKLYISSLTVAQFVSIFQKHFPSEVVKKTVNKFIAKFTIVGFSDKDIKECLEYKNPDLEDVIQYVISQKFKCRHIVTNNVKDFIDEDFLAINIINIDNYRSLNQ